MVPQPRADLWKVLPFAVVCLVSTARWAPAQDERLLSAVNPTAKVDAWDKAQRKGNVSIAATEYVNLHAKLLLDLPPGSERIVALDLHGKRNVVLMRYFQNQLEHKIYVGQVEGDKDATIVFGIAPNGIGSAVIEFGSGEAYELNYTGSATSTVST